MVFLGYYGYANSQSHVQSAKTVSLTQDDLETHIQRLCGEIKVLDDKAEATAYETEETRLLLQAKVTRLEDDLQAAQNNWKQELADLQQASEMQLNSEREKLRQSALLKIRTLQDELNASNASHAKDIAGLEAKHTAEKAKLAAELGHLQEELKALDPHAYACKMQAAEEEAAVLALRQQAEAAQLCRQPSFSQLAEAIPKAIPIPAQTASTCPALASSWPGHDGSATCFRGLCVKPKSEEAPGQQIARYILTADDSPTAEAVPETLQRIRSPSETIPMEQQQVKQTQPAQSMQEPEEPPIQEQDASGGLSPIEDETDLQVAAEPLTAEEDGADTAASWSMCGAEGSWVDVPDWQEHPESNDGAAGLYMYKSVQEARGISHILTLSWESFIFKHPSLELVCSNPSRTCFPNCSTGICRHGATHCNTPTC